MKLKLKARELRRQLVSGELPETRPQLAQTFGWILSFFLGFLLAGVPVGDSGGPFGIAVTAIIGGTLGGALCAIGASASYLAFYGFETGIRFVAAVALTFTSGYVCQELKIYRSRWFMPSLAALFTLLTGLLSSFSAPRGSFLLLPLILHTLLAFGGAYFFREALSRGERATETAELRHTVALVILLACTLMVLSQAMIAELISVGRVLSLLLVMVAGYKCGAVTGAAVGLILGLSMDAASAQLPFYAMSYATAALISGVFSRHGRIIYFVSFTVTAGLCVLCIGSGGFRVSMLYETGLACLGFAVMPGGLMGLIGGAIKPTEFDGGETGLRKYTARRVQRMGEAFRDLYSTVDSAMAQPEPGDDYTRVFDRASEVVCSRCKNKNLCWNSNYMDTLAAFNDTADAIRSRGLLLANDLPQHFSDACLAPEALVSAVNGELRGQMYRRQFRARLAENRSAAYGQYFDIAEILSGVSEELENAYGPDLLAQRRLLRYLSSMELEADVSVFRDRAGRLHIIMESARLKHLMREPGYLDRISAAVGVRLCHPNGLDADAEGRITLLEAEPYSVSVGIASLKKKGERVSGDRGTYFKTDQGVLCILLSDGMGSGESAARESVAAVRILERFLRTGVDPAVAMKMLNGMMLLKNDEEWGFATVDLMCVDLFTGEACFYKYGAAPSYVRTGKSIKRVKSESLAAGLMTENNSLPDIVRLRMRPGAVALIASDGVIAETNDEWIRKLLAENDCSDTKALARETLQQALRQYGCSDDMTVLAVKMEERG